MRKYFITALAVFTVAAFSCAQNLTKAQTDFKTGMYTQAAQEFAPFLSSKDLSLRYEAQLKTVLSYYNLRQYDKALQSIYSFDAPKDGIWLARYYYIKAVLLEYNNSVYSQNDLEESQTDPLKFTYAQKEKAAKDLFSKLWDMRKELVNFPTRPGQEYLQLNYSSPDPVLMPTMFDFLETFWIQNGTASKETVLEEAYNLDGQDRGTVREISRIERILMLQKNDNPQDILPMAQCLDYVAGISGKCKKYKEIKPFLFRAKEVLGQTKAAIEAANLYIAAGQYTQAARAADYCLSMPLNYFTMQCKQLKDNIQKPVLNFDEENRPQFNVPAGKSLKVKVKSANVNRFYVSLFPLSADDFAEKCNSSSSTCYTRNPRLLEAKLINAKPSRVISAEVKYPQEYSPAITEVEIPFIENGFYAAKLGSSKNFSKHDDIIFLNFTDLAAFVTAYKDRGGARSFGIYTVDAKNGTLKPNVKIYSNQGYGKTNAEGETVMPVKQNDISLLASNYTSNAIIPSLYYGSEYQNNYQILTNTDRSVYRPGQEIKAAFTVVEKTAGSYAPYVGQEKLNLKIYSASKLIVQQDLALDDMGSAEYTFKIPQDIMTGEIELVTRFKNASSSKHIRAEEYKRPEFSVLLDQNASASKAGKPLTISGAAEYYYGSPVQNANVVYKINRTVCNFWFCYGFFEREPEISGQTKTDKNGIFKITFTPDKNAQNPDIPRRYEVKAFVTDAGGRTITDAQTYSVSEREKFFKTESDKNFFRADTENYLTVQMINADNQPLEGKAEIKIYSAKADKDSFASFPYEEPEFEQDKLVKAFDAEFSNDGPSKINLPPLKEGFYIAEFIAKDSEGKDNESKFNFIVANTLNCKLNLPQITLPEEKVYYIGQKALVLLGAADAKGPKYIEIYKNGYLLGQTVIPANGVAALEVPLNEAYAGGFNISWFAAYDMKSYHGSAAIEVPYAKTGLKLNINGEKSNMPGKDAAWTLEVKDEDGNPVNARAFVTAYDKSLDYYVPYKLDLPQVYASKDFSQTPFADSLESGGRIYMAKGMLAGRAMLASDKVMNNALAAAPTALESDAAAPQSGSGAAEEQTPVAIRENFAETACWAPRVNVKNGSAQINFTMPQRFTQWAMAAFAFTKNMKNGKTSFDFTVKQDFMARLETPRFLREGDEFLLKALLTNNSDKVLTISAELIANLDDKDAKDILGIKTTNASLKLNPGEQTYLTWPIKAPQGSGVFSFTLIAKAGALSDGETKTFPLLPAAQRLSESKTIAVSDGSNQISLEDLAAEQKDIKLEAVYLTIEPSLIMPVLNSMPLLTYGSDETATGLLNSYLPLAILNGLYQKYPDFRTAAENLPKRDSVLPQWSPERQMMLGELSQSPWYAISKGYDEEKTINLFDPSLVNKQRAAALLKLKDYQNKDGGFSWIKGGQSNTYITLYALDKMARARDFAAIVPDDMIKKALSYLTANISLDIVSPSYDNLASSLYLSYVLTSYPADWYSYDVKKLMEASEDFSSYMTPFGQACAAIVWHRLGAEDKSALYVNRLFDSAKTEPENGMYWEPEERSWMWYNDSVTQHVMAIKALETVNPADPRIKELVKWLMFDRTAQQWGSTEETAKAVYTLLEVMDKNAALTQSKIFNINWNGEENILEVKPYDTLNANFTFGRYQDKAKPEGLKAVINKKIQDKPNASSLDDFASLGAIFTSSAPQKQSPRGMMNISKKMFIVRNGKMSEIKDGDFINPGDEIRVRLSINCKNAFDFVRISDPKPAAFEADALLSGWKYDNLARYEEVRDNATNFYMDKLPAGTYELNYTLRPTTQGVYGVGAAVMQSMFAPQYSAHSNGFEITVKQGD